MMKMMKAVLTTTLMCLALTCTEAFHHQGMTCPPVIRSLSTTTTTTSLSAAISPDRFAGNKVTSRPTTKANQKSLNNEDLPLQVKKGEVVLEPYFGIANGILAAAPVLLVQHTLYLGHGQVPLEAAVGAAIHLILGIYVYKQTQRVRCVFDKTSFEFKNIKPGTRTLVTKPNQNYVKGGRNRWQCNTVTNFGYFPSRSYPLITWFQETETPRSQWGEYGAWGKMVTLDPKQPAIHFFPGFIDMERWEQEMRSRGAQQQPSKK